MTGYWALLQIFHRPRFIASQKYPVPNWIALKSHFVQEPQKKFSSVFPLDIEHRLLTVMLFESTENFNSFQQQRLQLKNSMKILSQNILR